MEEIHLVRRPVRGRVELESPCSVKARLGGSSSIGAFSYIERNSRVTSATIGRYCSIAQDVVIGPTSHPTDWFSTHLFVFAKGGPLSRSQQYRRIRKPTRFAAQKLRTRVGNDVWIGARAVLRKGVTVGDGAIIGAGAVVVKDILPYEIVGGVPARHIRFRFEPAVIERLLALQWWKYDLSSPLLEGVDYADVTATLTRFESLVAAGSLPLLQPAVQRYGAGDSAGDNDSAGGGDEEGADEGDDRDEVTAETEPPAVAPVASPAPVQAPETTKKEAGSTPQTKPPPQPRKRTIKGSLRKMLRKLAKLLE